MKKLTSIILILFLSLLSSPSWSETFQDLVKRDGLYYKKFTDEPFTGKITGNEQGLIKNGKRTGEWLLYHRNGQLWHKGEYKNGKKDGEWVYYWENGQIWEKGKYDKDSWRDGEWVYYYDNGQLEKKGKFKSGRKEGEWIVYQRNGAFAYKDTYKNNIMQ